jgi:polyisoprenyl-teichoic acid--peptidoglycan teichoic acid transferase
VNDSGSPTDPGSASKRDTNANSSFAGSAQPRRRSSTKRPRRFGYYFKWTAISLFLLFMVTAGSVYGYFYRSSKAFQDIFTPHAIVNGIIHGDMFTDYSVDKQFPNQHTMNVLVLGCDSDYVEHVDHPIVVKNALGRSDSIMVAHIDFDKQTVNMLSIPRDTAAPIPGQRGYHKINGAHSIGGNELSARTITQDFGIPIDHTVSLNFDSFQKVVDAVHGVDITVHKPLNYDDNWGHLHVHLKPGPQHLDGYQAMGYVRIRHSDSDLARAERQHEFIEALRARVKDPSTFKNLPDVINAITDDIKADLNNQQMLSLVHYATTLPKENIHLATLEGEEGRSYVYTYPDKATETIGKMFFEGNTAAVKLNVAPRERVLAMNGHGRLRNSRRSRHRRARTTDSSAVHGTSSSSALETPNLPDSDLVAPVHTDSPGGNVDGAGKSDGDKAGKGAGDSGGKDDKGGNGASDRGKNDNARRTGDGVFS